MEKKSNYTPLCCYSDGSLVDGQTAAAHWLADKLAGFCWVDGLLSGQSNEVDGRFVGPGGCLSPSFAY